MFIGNKQNNNFVQTTLKRVLFASLILLIALGSPFYAQARIQHPDIFRPLGSENANLEAAINDVISHIDVRMFLAANRIRSVEDYAQWLKTHLKYKKDADRDVWSPPAETLKRGFGDCEDLAFLTSEVLKILGYQPRVIAVGLQKEAHVVCLFKKENQLHVFDNTSYYQTKISSMKKMFHILLANKKAYYMLELSLNPKNMRVLFALTRKKG